MRRPDDLGLAEIVALSDRAAKCIVGAPGRVTFEELAGTTILGGRLNELAGKSVLLRNSDQFTAARALIELDGVARRIVLCPQGLDPHHLAPIAAIAEVDAIVSDFAEDAELLPESPYIVPGPSRPSIGRRAGRLDTQWVLTTSGTTGVPKLVAHTLASLSAPIRRAAGSDEPIVWGTFYDIRRYGGLQIFLRALLGGHSLLLSGHGEPTGAFLRRLAADKATHISGTPSHWRSTLMSPAAETLDPHYVRLSGEIADQAILDALKAFYPRAAVSHAYASTEAGVGFEVKDEMAGFPASLVDTRGGSVDLRILDGSLQLRSPAVASHYLGEAGPMADADGFVDSGDVVERRGDRYYFAGRHGGIINVGGLKVHPEEVEAVINEQPGVRLSLVSAQKNPLSGAIVVADIVAADDAGVDLETNVLQACRRALARHKVPVRIRRVTSLEVGANGKLVRRHG